MLNIIILQGRLTKNLELKQTQSDKAIVRFDIAVNKYTPKEHPEADFFTIVAWEQTAEFICKYFKKGDLILIQGQVRTGKYTDDNGITRKTFEVWAKKVDFCGSKKGGTDNGEETNVLDDDELPF
ncbi:MAG: single-stranded DNA-binding protein [Oscillospiraceae bacterium]|jgi:single-strand DNA-binding protein|nr:single-stranded DNA-binding protein [Oscillospiraceae bacterium]